MTRKDALAFIRLQVKNEWNYNMVPVEISEGRIVDGFFICNQGPWIGEIGFTYTKGYDNSQLAESDLSDEDIFKIEKGVAEWIEKYKK